MDIKKTLQDNEYTTVVVWWSYREKIFIAQLREATNNPCYFVLAEGRGETPIESQVNMKTKDRITPKGNGNIRILEGA